MSIFLVISLFAGFLLSNQSPINVDLRRYAGSPFLSGLISFVVGTIFLAVMTLITTGSLLPSLHFILTQPWWIWLGGLLGAVYLTSNILLFPRLGALQTVILPILGQILMGMVIDSFGLFGSPRIIFTLMRASGILILLVGVLIAVVLPNLRKKPNVEKDKERLAGWQIWGVLIGMMGATQQAINGHLGVLLKNSSEASFISFLIGTILILFVVLLVDRRLPSWKTLRQAKAWNFFGGILGSLFVLATVIAVPHIGAGLTVVMGLIGQIIGSMLVQQFGWWKSPKYQIVAVQIVGVLVMLLGVVFIKFL
ncbi:DMT family transporter [Lactococcus protaetiae]|uniref:DMT family transporter n=1 Tax=Lactococcus protaetiae TaxID=2592653 RepID=A0A514ZAV5_9LACT|nr:DMT family transporter [Lactococcus protaetiae]QDK71722.1 DMT family transporter [Lactococcus protaetiae]